MDLPGLVRMTFVVGLGCLAIPGCAADTAAAPPAEDGAAVDELNASSLRASTAMKGAVAAGSAITLHYDRTDAKYPRAIPYLAVEIVSARAAGAGGLRPMNGSTNDVQTIAIEGLFPGTPRALVVDENFQVIARGTGVAQPDGSELATFNAPRQGGKRFVLVRDGLWSRPMDFQVRIGE